MGSIQSLTAYDKANLIAKNVLGFVSLVPFVSSVTGALQVAIGIGETSNEIERSDMAGAINVLRELIRADQATAEQRIAEAVARVVDGVYEANGSA